MEIEEFHAKTEAFLSWLSNMGIVMNPKVTLGDLRIEGRGRGVVAITDLEENELLFSIPRSAVLNTKNFLEEAGNSLENSVLALPSWLVLTIVILTENAKQNSKWGPYLDTLPQNLDTLVFWSEKELSQLQASAVVQKIGKASAEELFSQAIAPLDIKNYSTDVCHRVASIIMAYAFDIPENTVKDDDDIGEEGDDLVSDDGEDEQTILSMIPLADMLNADADRNNARLCYDNETLEMRTIKCVRAGEEIFNDYGQLPRSDLLRRYGYITDNYALYDVVEISAESLLSVFRGKELLLMTDQEPFEPLSGEELEKRVELAERENVYEDSYDLSHPGPEGPSIPNTLLAFLYLLLIDNESLRKIWESEATLPSRSKLATERVCEVLVAFLELREKEYATTLEDDESLLRTKNLGHRFTMAVHVRTGEKRVLKAAIEELRNLYASNKKTRTQGRPFSSGDKRKQYESSNPKKRVRIG